MRCPALFYARRTLTLTLTLTLLTGCGSSSTDNEIASKTAEQIVVMSRMAADGAATVHVSGSAAGAGGPLSLDLQLVAGKGGQGHIAVGRLDFKLIQIGRFAYIKGNPAIYRKLGAPLAGELRGGWLKVKTKGALAAFAGLTNLDSLVDTTLTSHGTLARKGTSTLDGHEVVAIDDLAMGGTLYVAAQGSPYPLEVRTPGGGTIRFDHWNQPVTLAAPTDVVNVNQLAARR
jgi:hypothetical protein